MEYLVSFRPGIPMEENLLPFSSIEEPGVRKLLRGAAGVLLPDHVTPARYESITREARSWFPRQEARFLFFGKSSQSLLFQRLGIRHPESLVFETPPQLTAYLNEHGAPWGYPMVLKGDRGGGGSTVFPIRSPEDVAPSLAKLPAGEPLLLQRWVEHGGKDLRVVIYGSHAVSYFRVGGGAFYNNVCRGGRVDHEGWPRLQEKGVEAVRRFRSQVSIDIAGFDLMFPDAGDPVFVEINYHFGKKGLGGSKGHGAHVNEAIRDWRNLCLSGAGNL